MSHADYNSDRLHDGVRATPGIGGRNSNSINNNGLLSLSKGRRWYGIVLVVVLACQTLLPDSIRSLTFREASGLNFQSLSSSSSSSYRKKAIPPTNNNKTTTIHDNNNKKNDSSSPIYDFTLDWDPNVTRLWLLPNLAPSQRPPAMLLLTTEGYNNPNDPGQLSKSRHVRETAFYNAVINHPWFHPTLWHDIQYHGAPIPKEIRFHVFLDCHQYRDSNYPIYGGFTQNNDGRYSRTTARQPSLWDLNQPPPSLVHGRLFVEAPNQSRAILFYGNGWGPPDRSQPNNRKNGTISTWPISLVPISGQISNIDETWDQGLIPPAGNPTTLTLEQVKDIQSCRAETGRRYFVTYVGNFRNGKNRVFHTKHSGGARSSYKPLHDNARVFAVRHFVPAEYNASALANQTYQEVLSNSVFALAPRGDNKFSYRFAEVLSAGAIPVVHADDWLWPFRPSVVDWNRCAVILPEKDAGRVTLQYLETLSVETRCRMRQSCYEIYKRYVENEAGTIDGIVQGLELVAQGKRAPLNGVRCDQFDDPSDCNMQRRRL